MYDSRQRSYFTSTCNDIMCFQAHEDNKTTASYAMYNSKVTPEAT